MAGSILLLLALVLSSACMSSYAPPAPVAPLLRPNEQLAVAGHASVLPKSLGGTVYVTAAPTRRSRLYASGSITRGRGWRSDTGEDVSYERTGSNHTEQGELGGGFGLARPGMMLDALFGAGYGRTDAFQCQPDFGGGDIGYCLAELHLEFRSVRPFLQLDMAAQVKNWTFGGGTRSSFVFYMLEELEGEPSTETAWVPTLEPFLTVRYDLGWGKLGVGVHAPIVLTRHRVSYLGEPDYDGMRHLSSQLLAIVPSPRLTLEIQVHWESLWKKGARVGS